MCRFQFLVAFLRTFSWCKSQVCIPNESQYLDVMYRVRPYILRHMYGRYIGALVADTT